MRFRNFISTLFVVTWRVSVGVSVSRSQSVVAANVSTIDERVHVTVRTSRILPAHQLAIAVDHEGKPSTEILDGQEESVIDIHATRRDHEEREVRTAISTISTISTIGQTKPHSNETMASNLTGERAVYISHHNNTKQHQSLGPETLLSNLYKLLEDPAVFILHHNNTKHHHPLGPRTLLRNLYIHPRHFVFPVMVSGLLIGIWFFGRTAHEGSLLRAASNGLVKWGFAGTTCGGYIVLGSCLVVFNKILLHEERFPFPLAISTFHTSFSLLCTCAVYVVRPQLFTSMHEDQGAQALRWQFLPLGFLYAGSLVAANAAYLLCTVAFLQFMKQSSVVVVFYLSWLAGLQKIESQRLFLVAWIAGSVFLSISGEAHFSMLGFWLQLIAQILECTKNVFGEQVLAGPDLKLDPLTYTMLITTSCLTFLIMAFGYQYVFAWNAYSAFVYRFEQYWPYLLLNSCLAFALNLYVAKVLNSCTSAGFVFAGILKDIVLVGSSATLFRASLSLQQKLGFSLAIGGILLWAGLKRKPTDWRLQE